MVGVERVEIIYKVEWSMILGLDWENTFVKLIKMYI